MINKSINHYELENEQLTKKFIDQFSENSLPVEVSFKRIFPELSNSDRYTHLIHSYPAKLLMHIPFFFLNNNFFSKKGDLVLDPFCGTGTVLLESMVSGRPSIGSDANPLARLIAEVKTSRFSEKVLLKNLEFIQTKYRRYKSAEIPEVVHIDYWFPSSTQTRLAKLLRIIKEIKEINYQNFFLVCLSNCVKKVSLADPRISVPVRLNPNRFPAGSEERERIQTRLEELENADVLQKFTAICSENIRRIKSMKGKVEHLNTPRIISSDARHLTNKLNSKTKLKDESVQLIITSPPYAGAQKYIRSSSLSLGWLQLAKNGDLKLLDKKNIGRENFTQDELLVKPTGIKSADQLIQKIEFLDKTRACIVCEYLLGLTQALNESMRVLRKDGFLILIVGNNKVCNLEFNTQEYLTEYLMQKGLQLQFKLIDDIKSYGLMTKRNKTADIISREWILVFKKCK
jgi:DNA modification methylase